jgi:phospholipid/cholesterol/gamma-HCH transport system substrate-binding protein
METRAHHVLIGAFVLLTLLGGLLFSLWVAKVNLDAEFDEYDVVFRETVTGLTKGAAVNFNGIQVGEVRRLTLDKADAANVLARVRVDAATPIRSDTSARLTYTGLTGVAIIELVAGKPDAPPAEPPEGAEVALIVAQPSTFQKFMTDGGDVLTRVNEALGRINQVLSDENIARLDQTLVHVEAVAAQYDHDKAALGQAFRNADQTFADLSAAADRVERLAADAGETLERADRMLAGDLKGSAKDLRRTLASLREIAAEVDTLLATNAAQIEQLAQQGVPGLNAALGDLQSLAASLNRIAARLETAPADYLLQRDRPKEYRGK